jgi:hypothetical protein
MAIARGAAFRVENGRIRNLADQQSIARYGVTLPGLCGDMLDGGQNIGLLTWSLIVRKLVRMLLQ